MRRFLLLCMVLSPLWLWAQRQVVNCPSGTASTTACLSVYDSSNNPISADVNDGSQVIYNLLLPGTDNLVDLGSNSKRWRNFLLAGNATIGGNMTATGDATVKSLNIPGDGVHGAAWFGSEGTAPTTPCSTGFDNFWADSTSHALIFCFNNGTQFAMPNPPAPSASPGLTGTPTAPTAVRNVSTTQIATTQFVHNVIEQLPITEVVGFSTASDGSAVADTGISRLGSGWLGLGNGTYQDVTAKFVSGNTTSQLTTQTITSTGYVALTSLGGWGLTSNNMASVSFECNIVYEQATAASNIQFGAGMSNNSGTTAKLDIHSRIYRDSVGTSASQYTAITATGAQNMTAITAPANFGVAYEAHWFGTFIGGSGTSSSETITFYGRTDNASDALLIMPGSECHLTP